MSGKKRRRAQFRMSKERRAYHRRSADMMKKLFFPCSVQIGVMGIFYY
jgi:hypothetical protein